MRLADFIDANIEPILQQWESFAREIAPGKTMDALALRDHAEDILLATVQDMRSAQSQSERSARSKGRHGGGDGQRTLNGASEQHAIDRLGSGFDLPEVVSEYRALRASVLQLWRDSAPALADTDVEDVTRFNESIDQSLAKAVSSYTKRIDQSRDLFLAILSHDLRNPLNSISMSAALLHQLFQSDPEAIGMASQISSSAEVMARMISDLLDYTRTRLGAGMPVDPAPMDLGSLGKELFEQFQSAHPERAIRFQATGDLAGQWDADRMRQAISNLLGNAIQHSSEGARVELRIHRDGADVVVVVHNGGDPIPPGELSKIFEPLVRGSSAGNPPKNRPGSIGLGLYIARQIAVSHGGDIEVTSTAAAGTSFTVRMPRTLNVNSGDPILDEEHLQSM
jgi:signal transduction histidine kinase